MVIARGALLCCLSVAAAEAHPRPRPTLAWSLAQLLPSPGIAIGQGRTSTDLRWQLTPLLYSWGVNHRVSRWRTLVVDPFARVSGSSEVFVSPEIVLADRTPTFLRTGFRAYVPVLEHGEMLAVSAGVSWQRIAGRDAVAVEVGGYLLFGIAGLQISYAFGPASPAQTIATLSLRYF